MVNWALVIIWLLEIGDWLFLYCYLTISWAADRPALAPTNRTYNLPRILPRQKSHSLSKRPVSWQNHLEFYPRTMSLLLPSKSGPLLYHYLGHLIKLPAILFCHLGHCFSPARLYLPRINVILIFFLSDQAHYPIFINVIPPAE